MVDVCCVCVRVRGVCRWALFKVEFFVYAGWFLMKAFVSDAAIPIRIKRKADGEIIHLGEENELFESERIMSKNRWLWPRQ